MLNHILRLVRCGAGISVVGIATGYGLEDRVPVGEIIVSSPRRPDRLWGPPNLSNGYRGLFPQR
jgi:nicotinamide mononucleotide (NMN) deamidase PncC